MSIFFAARAVVVTAVALTAARVPLPVSQVPLVVRLTVVTAVSNLPLGDYELDKTVTSASASDGITLNVMVDLPSNDSKKHNTCPSLDTFWRPISKAATRSSTCLPAAINLNIRERSRSARRRQLSEISDKAEKRNLQFTARAKVSAAS